ncbi:BMP family ABC transporter substrate-binding protein [Demequina sp. SYSU T00192]|uniref:BMP family ABC transporter substrate-binding protein n=1 Tax=Demequina litoralis TaxID=3051660 RepID=A0ABT8GBQ9_9MICO|nr:BMP family ABC transporter substrate-binding protein [Demequina sp. SYSU T00192]MDN4476581.1 BMP family ABC transporter substrate-binding protein [Demequina sp. SYSU T00192]
MKNTIRVGAIAAVSALALAACASAPEEEATSSATADAPAAAEPVDFKACMVSDSGGFDDQSFNQSGFEGLTRAEAELGIEIATAESATEADFAPNIEAQVAAGCDLIITVGFLLSQATVDAALANPDVHFAIIDDLADNDFDGEIDAPNIKPITFETDEASFLAGYAASSATGTGTLSTFGGMNIPSVTIFMSGFLAGANYYNDTNSADVKVLGWDGTDGQFTGDFSDQTKGKNVTEEFLSQGADVVMPVAGPVGLGAASAVQSAGDAWLIGVDSDWTLTTDYADIIFTSVLKNIGNSVFDTISETIDAGFSTEPYVGTLENEGVGVADFAEGTVDDAVLTELETIKAGIIDGSISVDLS